MSFGQFFKNYFLCSLIMAGISLLLGALVSLGAARSAPKGTGLPLG